MYKQSSGEIFKVLPNIVSEHVNGARRVSAVKLGRQYSVNSRSLNVNLQKLVHAKILYSQTGGHNPGYGFVRDPREVSLYEIYQIVCYIDHPRCSLTEYTAGENCMVCNIVSFAANTIVRELKAVSCYDFYLSLKDKMQL